MTPLLFLIVLLFCLLFYRPAVLRWLWVIAETGWQLSGMMIRLWVMQCGCCLFRRVYMPVKYAGLYVWLYIEVYLLDRY